MIFNKQIKDKEKYLKILGKIRNKLGYWKRAEQLTEEDKKWLKKNIKQFDEEVLKVIAKHSIAPDKPMGID